MMGGLAFIAKGGMCCSVSGRGGLLVRVDADAQAQLVAQLHVQPLVMGGRPVSSFVRVMPEGYRTHAALKKWVKRGLDAVATLPAKPKRQPAKKTKTLTG